MEKECMYKLTYGLFVVSARKDKKQNGCITNTVMQVTTTPNCISVTINKDNFTHGLIKETGIFNVSVLSEKADFSIFEQFGFKSGRDVEKLETFDDFEVWDNGVFFVTRGVNAVICAEVIQSVDLGTHTTFIAKVTDGWVMRKDNSVTYAYYLNNIKPKPQPKKTEKTVWRCKICGYEYEGENLPEDFICPICKHGADDFEKV
ncbi:MAG: flavin reductase [Clostridia bacterium]|nr:flavin reductase [Clostridia bacterium]